MASVKSSFRNVIKPILYNLLGERHYALFQTLGKIRDINKRLVEEAELEILPQLVGVSDDVLDIGANYAYYTHRLSRLCPNGRVFAFEPIPFTHKVCRNIIDHYRLKNVFLYEKGVGDKSCQMDFNVPIADFGGISAGQAHLAGRNNDLAEREKHYQFSRSKTVACDIVALDDFLTDLKQLTFVKIDIEGAEYFALLGMKNLLARFKPAVLLEINPFFLNGFGIPERTLNDFIVSLGYEVYRYDQPTKKLKAHQASTYLESNYLLLHRERVKNFAHLIEH